MDNQQLIEEIWKDIIGFEGYYQISSTGRVKSLQRLVKSARSSFGYRTVHERFLATTIDKYGYETVRLHKEGKTFPYTIHRLVALHFVNNPDQLPSINHIDENKLNNHYTNLEWCTVKYNNTFNYRQEKINELLRLKDWRNPKVLSINLEDGSEVVYKGLRDAMRHTGFVRQEISKCCRGLRPSYNGFVWKFLK